jgi:hypothetical protein
VICIVNHKAAEVGLHQRNTMPQCCFLWQREGNWLLLNLNCYRMLLSSSNFITYVHEGNLTDVIMIANKGTPLCEKVLLPSNRQRTCYTALEH